MRTPPPPATTSSNLADIGRLFCLAGALLGLLGLLGWITECSRLTSVIPGQPPMMPNTATALLLLGLAGALRHRENPGRPREVLAIVAALVVLAIGGGTLLEYALQVDLHIDQLLLRAEGEPYPGRPSPLTALALLLLAIAILVFDANPGAPGRPSEALALAAGLIGFASLTGIAFGASRLYRLSTAPVIGVALPTAAGVLLMTAGLLLERPKAGFMRIATSPGPGGLMLRRLALPTLLMPALLGMVILRLFGPANTEPMALSFAYLAAALAIGGMALIAITAVPLDRAHVALESARDRARALVEQAADGIFVADRHGHCIEVNRVGHHMLGYDHEELIGRTIAELVPSEDVKRLHRFNEQLAEGTARIGEWALLRKDGTRLPVEVSAKVLPDGRWHGLLRDISERKRLEHALRLSEARASGILSISADAIICIDDEQRITLFNDGAEQIFGWSKEEAIGAPLDILIPEHLRDRHRRHVEGFAAGPHVARGMFGSHATLHGLRKNREEFLAEASISKLELGSEQILTVALRDVTEQHEARERLELALKGANLAMWDWNIETGEVLFNARWAEMRGFRLEDVEPHVNTWVDGLHPDDWPRTHKALNDHFEGLDDEYSSELRVRTKSGDWIWILDRGKVFARDQSGRPTRMVGVELDITERKRFEEALRASEHEERVLAELGAVLASTLGYDEMAANIADLAASELADICIVKTTDDDGHLRRWAIAHRDPSKAELVESLLRTTLDPRRPHLASMAFETKQTYVMDEMTPEYLESIAQGDEPLQTWRALDPKSLIALPLMAHGRLVGAMVLISTITPRRFSDRERGLAEKVAIRSAHAIDNARLYWEARRAIQARDDVLGIVAHDLRNPLSIIQMQAMLLRGHGLPSKDAVDKAADTLERAVGRMGRLIQDLLDVTAMEANTLSLERALVSPAQVIRDAVQAQDLLAVSRSLELRVEVAKDLPELWADRDRLLQVIENLIGNALKLTEPGGRITLGAAAKDGEVAFWVTDTGPGIAAKDLPHLFERFWQAPRARRRGAGLGLPIVKGIVEAHGGRVWVESTLGRGSTFSFAIPAASADGPEEG